MILWGAFNGQIQVFVPEDTFGDDRPDFLKNSLMRRFFCDNWLYIKTADYVYIYSIQSQYKKVTIALSNMLFPS